MDQPVQGLVVAEAAGDGDGTDREDEAAAGGLAVDDVAAVPGRRDELTVGEDLDAVGGWSTDERPGGAVHLPAARPAAVAAGGGEELTVGERGPGEEPVAGVVDNEAAPRRIVAVGTDVISRRR